MPGVVLTGGVAKKNQNEPEAGKWEDYGHRASGRFPDPALGSPEYDGHPRPHKQTRTTTFGAHQSGESRSPCGRHDCREYHPIQSHQ